MRLLIEGLTVAAIAVVAPAARAQTVGPPPIRWVGASGDSALGSAKSSSPAILFEPLRLDLSGAVIPLDRTMPGCSSWSDPNGGATAAKMQMPNQFVTALSLGPRLTLFGVSRDGCPVDAAAAVGLVYTVPIRPNIYLAIGIGAHVQPAIQGFRQKMQVQTVGRADVVFDRGNGRSFNVGVRSTGAQSGLSFGGIF